MSRVMPTGKGLTKANKFFDVMRYTFITCVCARPQHGNVYPFTRLLNLRKHRLPDCGTRYGIQQVNDFSMKRSGIVYTDCRESTVRLLCHIVGRYKQLWLSTKYEEIVYYIIIIDLSSF